MANLNDYGIRFISHGEWSDAEIEFEKSDYQKLLFNYWDVAECTDYEEIISGTPTDADFENLIAQLKELSPQGFACPRIYYEWEIETDDVIRDDSDYYRENKLTEREDFVLHTTHEALRQALEYLDNNGYMDASIQIWRREYGYRNLVANYAFQGSTLKDKMWYKSKIPGGGN